MDLRKLKELRENRGISLVELSKKTGIDRNRLSKMERGVVNPSYGSVASVVSCLGYELRVVM
jgi:transcriptional regulator with XRE-family HTH domain